MRTIFQTPADLAAIFLQLAEAASPTTPKRPDRFIKMMQSNIGSIGLLSPGGLGEDGLEPKNPLVVAIGDSVTAGHFELTKYGDELLAKFTANPPRSLADFPKPDPARPGEITDARVCYLELFRQKLIDKYEQTSVSVLNAGLAGDSIFGMYARLDRDVIRYQPDLVLINGSLNWNDGFGGADKFKAKLSQMVREIKAKTPADIVLMTPNLMLGSLFATVSTLSERVAAIREVAVEEDVCLADTCAVWEEYAQQGYPLAALLANGVNHPSIRGHEAFAITLMKLFA